MLHWWSSSKKSNFRKSSNVSKELLYLQHVWDTHNMQYLKVSFQWYDNKELPLTVEAKKKMIWYYHNKGINVLELGCNLPQLPNIWLQNSTDAKFYPFPKGFYDSPKKVKKDLVEGPPTVFFRIPEDSRTKMRTELLQINRRQLS